MKAILLAAGEGSRLRPLTISKPKPMVRAANRPIAQYAVEALVANGVRDITMVVGYQRAKLQTYFGDGKKFGANITYAFQEGLLGTAHAVSTAPAPEEAFLVLGADNVVDANLVKRIISAPGSGPALAVHLSDTPSKYGVVSMDGGRIRDIREHPTEPRSDWISTGVYRFPAEFHATISTAVANGTLGLSHVLQKAVEAGLRVEAVKTEDLWADAVYPWDLFRVHAELMRLQPPVAFVGEGVHVQDGVLIGEDCQLEPGAVLGPGTCIGNNVRIGANSVLENCIVYDDVQIGPGAVLQNSVIGEGARIGARFTAPSGACSARALDGWHELEEFGCVVGEDAHIGGSVTVQPGSIVGNKSKVKHACVVRGNVEDGATLQ